MAFFDIPRDADISPEARRWLDEILKLRGIESPSGSWLAYTRSPEILEARLRAEDALFRQRRPSRFSFEARMMALMLVAHARHCDGCFGSARRQLTRLGFDEEALDGFCANPSTLALPEREGLFVQYVLRMATNPSTLEPKDFLELEARGFSREDVQEMAGLAAFSVFNTIFTTVATKALRDE
jgi:alkylhydroperoxidase family enzyme